MSMSGFSSVDFDWVGTDVTALADTMFALLMRNVAGAGYAFTDPLDPGATSRPGCIIAAPSYPSDVTSGFQDYVYNWTRDGAIAAMEMVAASSLALAARRVRQGLADYVTFADACQQSTAPMGYACFTIEAKERLTPQWTVQSDGPALQTLTMLAAMPSLDPTTAATAQSVIAKNLAYLLDAAGQPTFNIWEEKQGVSFFASAVQLKCLQAILTGPPAPTDPAPLEAAVAKLQAVLPGFWSDTDGCYHTLDPVPSAGYDPNTDIVMACIYGAVPCTDDKLLATAAKIRAQWEDPKSGSYYPINGDDAHLGIGPLIGRYPDDLYDGDVTDESSTPPGDHPWALCTANFAELYYRLAREIGGATTIPLTTLSAPFFTQIGVGAGTAVADAVTQLRDAGDRMLRAIVRHSDFLELSEQYDGATGFEKSVRNLTWSYAAVLSALRAR